MQRDLSQERAAGVATACNLAAAGCFFALASRVDDGATGYWIAGALFGCAAVANFLRWRRASRQPM